MKTDGGVEITADVRAGDVRRGGRHTHTHRKKKGGRDKMRQRVHKQLLTASVTLCYFQTSLDMIAGGN